MVRKICLIVCMLLLFAVPLSATQKSVSSGELTATASVATGTCYITSILIITDGTTNGKVIIDDSTDGSGTVKWEQTVLGGNHYGGKDWSYPVEFKKGIYVTLSGDGATFIVEYVTVLER